MQKDWAVVGVAAEAAAETEAGSRASPVDRLGSQAGGQADRSPCTAAAERLQNQRRLYSRVPGILLLERSLAEARWLRSERTGLLLRLLRLLLARWGAERTAILRLTGTHIATAA